MNFPLEHPDRIPLGEGMVLRHHPASECEPPCCFHDPSDHHMVQWPIEWRPDRGIVERICVHGCGHPDPDSYAYKMRHGGSSTVHGCDGCCRPEKEEE